MSMRPRAVAPDEQDFVAELMLGARIAAPYMGAALAAMVPVVAEGLGTVAVDRHWRLYLDLKWLAERPETDRYQIIAHHEAHHLLRNHGNRGPLWCEAIEKLQPNLPPNAIKLAFGLGADAEINGDGAWVPKDAFLASKVNWPANLLAEEYAERALANTSSCGCCGGGSGAGNPLEGEIDGPGSTTDKDGNSLPSGVPPEAVPGILSTVANAITKHEKQTHGSVPSGLVIWAESQTTKPVYDWRRELAKALKSTIRGSVPGTLHATWTRPPRRQIPGIIRPAYRGVVPNIAIVIDTSGSMGNEGDRVISEVQRICSICPKPLVIQADAAIQNLTRGRPKTFHGGGGTNLDAAIECADDAGCHVTVIVTDGELSWPTDPPKARIVIALVDNSAAIPSWPATIVRLKEQLSA